MKAPSLIPIVAMCGALAAHGSAAMAQTPEHRAERVLTETLYDVSEGAFVFGCSATGEPLPEGEGEVVLVKGHIYERFMLVTDGTGGEHYSVNTRPLEMRAIGETSGEEFRIRDSVQFTGTERLDGLVLSYHHEFKMVGKDTHRMFWITAKGHYLVLTDGTVRIYRDALRVGCRG
jgi:hypothetical protein